jgi:hypothetical protein
MYRDKDLLKLAQGEKCLFKIHPYCLGDEGSTTVAAHANEIIHGKGTGIKANDCMTVWACYRCHTMFDQGSLSKRKKAKIFDEAWYRQVQEWHRVADEFTMRPWKVEAARKVLVHIGARKETDWG